MKLHVKRVGYNAMMQVHYNARWVPASWVAICLGRHVFTRYASLSVETLAHEDCHVAQYGCYGFVGYLVRWFYWTRKVGYWDNPFEVQARAYARLRADDYRDWLRLLDYVA